MIGMDEVALMAKVSKATVSRVFSGGCVSEATRKRVIQACDRLNYKLNPNIQDLAKRGRTGAASNLALVIVDRDFSSHYIHLVDAIARNASARGLHLLFSRIDSGVTKTVYDLPGTLRDGRVDGILVTGFLSKPVTELLACLNIPSVVIGDYDPLDLSGLPCITAEQRTKMLAAIDAAFAAGYRRIAFADNNLHLESVRLALKTLQEGYCRNSVPWDDGYILTPTGTSCAEYGQMLHDYFKNDKITYDAFFTPSHTIADMIYHQIGCRFGFDNPKAPVLITSDKRNPYEVSDLRFTYRSFPEEQLATSAIDLVVKMQKHEKIPSLTLL